MKHIFIVNKISGKSKGLKAVTIIEKVARDLKLEYMVHITQYPLHAKAIAAQYKPEDEVTVYAVGGDGTILEVINGLDPAIPFGIIPCGSGNDFYRLLGNDTNNCEKIIIDTIKAECKKIDLGQSDRLRFINCTSIGLDADVNFMASSLIRKTFLNKGAAYALAIADKVLFPETKHLKIRIDGKDFEDDYFIATIMNGRYYGNGALPAPFASVNDGYFDVILIKKCHPVLVYLLLGKYLQGKHTADSHFTILKAKHIIVTCDNLMSIQSDGENYQSHKLEIKMVEKAISLKVPSYLDIIK